MFFNIHYLISSGSNRIPFSCRNLNTNLQVYIPLSSLGQLCLPPGKETKVSEYIFIREGALFRFLKRRTSGWMRKYVTSVLTCLPSRPAATVHFNDPSTVTTATATDKKDLGQRAVFTSTSLSSFTTSSALYATVFGLSTYLYL